MSWSNAQKLAAVVSFWARPALTQLATSRLSSLPMMQNLQQSIVASGLVSQAYNISADLMPIMAPVINNLLQPYLERQLAQLQPYEVVITLMIFQMLRWLESLPQIYLCMQTILVQESEPSNFSRRQQDVLAEAEKKGSMSIMDGFLTLEAQDIQELRQLVEKNLPMADRQGYEVII